MSITFTVTLTAKPGKEKALEELLSRLVAPTHKEPGCIQYELHRHRDNPNTFMFYEIWAGQAALDAHHQSAHIQAFRTKTADLIEKPRELNYWEKI